MNTSRRSPTTKTWPCAIAAIILPLLAGCRAAPAAHQPFRAPSRNSSTTDGPTTDGASIADPSGIPTVASASSNSVTLHRVLDYATADEVVGSLRVWSHYVAFAAAPPDAGLGAAPTRIEVIDLDLSTKVPRTIAHTKYRNGVTDWLAGTGDFIMWTDESDVPSDNAMAVAWDLHATNLVDGSDRVVASSHGAKQFIVPTPVAADGSFVWSEPNASSTSTTIYDYSAAGEEEGTLVTGVRGSDVEVTGGCVIYDDGPPNARQLFAVPLTGGKAQQITAAIPGWSSAHDDRVVWQEPANGQPQSLWTSSLGPSCHGSTPVQIETGSSQGNAVAGDGFVAYWDMRTAVQVIPVGAGDVGAEHPTAVSGPNTFVPTRIFADGKRIAWGEQASPNDKIHVIVSNVSTP